MYLFGHLRGAVEAFRNYKGLSVILSKSLDAIEHFTKVRIVLISHSIIFLNPEIKGFFLYEISQKWGRKCEKITFKKLLGIFWISFENCN